MLYLISKFIQFLIQNNSMLVNLTDTMEEEDVHINDWMVHQNLAVPGKMVCIRPRNFPFYYYLKCQEHNKTNSENLSSSMPDVTKTSKSSVLVNDLIKNLYKNLYRSSSASLNNSSRNNLVSNGSKNSAQCSKELRDNYIQSSHSEIPKRLNDILEISENDKQFHSDTKVLSNSDYNGKSDKRRLPLETSEYVPNVTQSVIRNENFTQMMSKKKNESKTVLKETDSSDCIFLATHPDKQENYNIKKNYTNFIKRNERDIEKCTQQKEQKHKDIPLPKRCFINAINLSLGLQSNYQDYDTSPDDNIITTNDNSTLLTKYKSNINLQNIEIGVPEVILSKLRSNRSYANDKSFVNILHNINDSLNQLEQLMTNISNVENSMLLNVQDSSSMIGINGKKDPICETYNASMQICNKSNEDAKLSSGNYSKNSDSNNETKIEVLDNKLGISTNEEISNLIYYEDVNENNSIEIISQSRPFLKLEHHCPEFLELHKSTKNAIKEVILTSNDNNLQCDKNECNIKSNADDVFGNYIDSNTKIHEIIETDDERLQITEVNENGSDKSLNVAKYINCNDDNFKDNLEYKISEMKMIKDTESTLLNDIDCSKSSDNTNEVKKNNDQALDFSMSLIQSNIEKEEHLDNVIDNVTQVTDNTISINSDKLEELIFENTDEKVIPIFDDTNLQYDSGEWSIEGSIDDFLGDSFLSNLKMLKSS